MGYAQTAAVNVSFYCQRAIWRTCSSYEIPTIVYTIKNKKGQLRNFIRDGGRVSILYRPTLGAMAIARCHTKIMFLLSFGYVETIEKMWVIRNIFVELSVFFQTLLMVLAVGRVLWGLKLDAGNSLERSWAQVMQKVPKMSQTWRPGVPFGAPWGSGGPAQEVFCHLG